jgi:hypothetical protein
MNLPAIQLLKFSDYTNLENIISIKNMKNFFVLVFSILGLLFTINTSLADTSPTSYSYNYQNPLTHGTLTEVIEAMLSAIQNVVGALGIAFLVIGGIMYITAGGKDSQLTLAKNTIISALIGLTLAIGAPSLLKEIKDIAGGSPTAIPATSFGDILMNVLNFVLGIIGTLAILTFIYSGLIYLRARGDASQVESAKKLALYSIIAVLISGGSLLIIETVINLMNNTL